MSAPTSRPSYRPLTLIVMALAMLLAMLGSGCNRWRSAHLRVVSTGDPLIAVDAARLVLEDEGYQLTTTDEAAGWIEVIARLDAPSSGPCAHGQQRTNDCPGRRSFIRVWATPNGNLEVSVHGNHVVRKKRPKPGEASKLMHRKLAREVDYLTIRFARMAEKLRPLVAQHAEEQPM